MANACLGGWCVKRDKCPHYIDGDGEPKERLCLRGRDGVRLLAVNASQQTVLDIFSGQWWRELSKDNEHDGS